MAYRVPIVIMRGRKLPLQQQAVTDQRRRWYAGKRLYNNIYDHLTTLLYSTPRRVHT